MTGLSRKLSAGDIETLEYCYNKLQETMDEDKKQRMQNMINDLKCKEEGVQKGNAGRSIIKAYFVPGL